MVNTIVDLIRDLGFKINEKNSYEYNGILVPRVTAIINRCIHVDSLMYWANSLGFKHQSYSKTLAAAANIGEQAHNSIDQFMDDNEFSLSPLAVSKEAYNAYSSFQKWFNDISMNASVDVLMHEHTMVCRWFGGTLDGLYRINDKVYLIDYKTSNHISYKYCLQLAAYRYMLRETMGIEIDGCIILQLSKQSVAYNEFVLDFGKKWDLNFINECEVAFMALVFAYYNISKIENEYKLLGWKS